LADAEGRALNHPANLASIITGFAHRLGHSPDEFRARLAQNFGNLFGAPTRVLG
jgi:hypothetical protein